MAAPRIGDRGLAKALESYKVSTMKAIEFDTTILPDGKIDVSKFLRNVLPHQSVRVILLWQEEEEEAVWQEAALSIFREGDGPYDALYDNL